MISSEQFLQYLERGEVPPSAPKGTSIRGHDFMPHISDEMLWKVRSAAREKHGMWSVVTQDWTKQLAEWIGKRACLEIMAGGGWLAKALHDHGVDIVATDDKSWPFHKKYGNYVHPIERIDAVKAVKKYNDRDILVVSWPYMDDGVAHACSEWGTDKPIVYIGEDEGGCTATDEFFDHFVEYFDAPDIAMLTWPGIHDSIHIGKWSNKHESAQRYER